MKATSIEAHNSVKDKKATMHRLIRKALSEIKQGSFRDIARQANLEPQQVWKRLSEMPNIVECDTKICPKSKRRVTVWTFKQASVTTEDFKTGEKLQTNLYL